MRRPHWRAERAGQTLQPAKGSGRERPDFDVEPSGWFLACSSLAVLVAFVHAQQAGPAPPPPLRTLRPVTNFVTVTDQIIRAPKADDWVFYRGNYQAWGWSALDQINTRNVRSLQLVWSRAMEPGVNQATPLVYSGVMYLGNPGDVIQAIDAATGDLMWDIATGCRR